MVQYCRLQQNSHDQDTCVLEDSPSCSILLILVVDSPVLLVNSPLAMTVNAPSVCTPDLLRISSSSAGIPTPYKCHLEMSEKRQTRTSNSSTLLEKEVP